MPDVTALVEQLRDIWTGLPSYDNEAEWLENLEAVIGDLCKATGTDTAEFPGA